MQTSKKTDYALHALMILARRKEDISVERLAEIQNIPETYLAKVMQKMSAAGIVKSSEGKGGGYSLSLPAEKIDIASIFKITEGKKYL
ncbi:MAG: RrF2 family transcriptional regulator, partial [Halanaerobiales bacterium]